MAQVRRSTNSLISQTRLLLRSCNELRSCNDWKGLQRTVTEVQSMVAELEMITAGLQRKVVRLQKAISAGLRSVKDTAQLKEERVVLRKRSRAYENCNKD